MHHLPWYTFGLLGVLFFVGVGVIGSLVLLPLLFSYKHNCKGGICWFRVCALAWAFFVIGFTYGVALWWGQR
jgi:hypothetical protein